MNLAVLPVITTEILKLKRSYALLLCVAAPALVALLTVLLVASDETGSTWRGVLNGVGEMWTYFMLPMGITALTVLIAQFEHGTGGWDHLLALPVARWQLFAAKAMVATALVAVMSVLLAVLVPAAGLLAEMVAPGTQLAGPTPWGRAAEQAATMFAAALCLIALQLWVALRFRSFVPGLALGIGGTFASGVADQILDQRLFLPWLLAQHAISSDPTRAAAAVVSGVAGGFVVGLLMLLDLSRVELARG